MKQLTDEEIINKSSFEEKLSHYKEEIKEFFNSYKNKSGSEDCMEVCLIRAGYRTVLEAENEINRQKAEIERLNEENKNYQELLTHEKGGNIALRVMYDKVSKNIKTAKSEAYKEFAERLKGKSYVFDKAIDDLLKEMVGDKL